MAAFRAGVAGGQAAEVVTAVTTAPVALDRLAVLAGENPGLVVHAVLAGDRFSFLVPLTSQSPCRLSL